MHLKSLSIQDSAEVRKFSDFLLRVGEGTEPENENHIIHLDQRFVVPGGSAANLVTAVNGDIRQYYNDAEYINRRILMCHKTDTTDFINEYVINQIPGEGKTLLSADSLPDDQAALYPTEFLNSITLSVLSPHRLYLKIHASVILLRSLDPTYGLCKGTLLRILAHLGPYSLNYLNLYLN